MLKFYKDPRFITALFLTLFTAAPQGISGEIILKNGDRLTAEKIEETSDALKIGHEIFGLIEISKKDVKSFSLTSESDDEKKEKDQKKIGDLVLDRRLAAGYEAQRGNTDTDSLHGELLYNRNRLWIDEWTLKAEGAQEYNQDKKTSQSAKGSLRYAKSFWKKFYGFGRLGAEHDRFENIDLRLTPTAGAGYWFWDEEALKLMTEAGLGYEYEFRHQAPDEGAPIAHFRESFSKRIGNVEFGGDLYYFPHLNEFSDYRTEAEGYLRFILSKHLAFKLKAADQYRSRPIRGKKKNDLRFTSSVEWLF